MEDVTVKGRSTYLVPKGAKREIIGSQVIVEPPNEYVARRLFEIEQDIQNRFEQILKEQEKIRTELETLKKEMEKTPAKEVEEEKSE